MTGIQARTHALAGRRGRAAAAADHPGRPEKTDLRPAPSWQRPDSGNRHPPTMDQAAALTTRWEPGFVDLVRFTIQEHQLAQP